MHEARSSLFPKTDKSTVRTPRSIRLINDAKIKNETTENLTQLHIKRTVRQEQRHIFLAGKDGSTHDNHST